MILVDEITEHRMIAALLAEPAVLRAASNVETQDFTDYRYWIVFAAIRQLEIEGADVDVLEVDRILEQRDATYGSFLRPQCGAAFLGELVLDAAPYNHRVLWEHDMWWIRELRRRRNRLEDAW